MIEDKFVDLYARNSGLRDKLVAERDVVLTYALRVLLDPEALFQKLRGGNYDWADIQRLVRTSDRIEHTEVIGILESRFAVLRELSRVP